MGKKAAGKKKGKKKGKQATKTYALTPAQQVAVREAAEARLKQLVVSSTAQHEDDADTAELTTEVARLCQVFNISVNLRTKALRRWTLLQVAVRNGNLPLVRLMMERLGGDGSLRDDGTSLSGQQQQQEAVAKAKSAAKGKGKDGKGKEAAKKGKGDAKKGGGGKDAKAQEREELIRRLYRPPPPAASGAEGGCNDTTSTTQVLEYLIHKAIETGKLDMLDAKTLAGRKQSPLVMASGPRQLLVDACKDHTDATAVDSLGRSAAWYSISRGWEGMLPELAKHSDLRALLSDQALTDGSSMHAIKRAAMDDHVEPVRQLEALTGDKRPQLSTVIGDMALRCGAPDLLRPVELPKYLTLLMLCCNSVYKGSDHRRHQLSLLRHILSSDGKSTPENQTALHFLCGAELPSEETPREVGGDDESEEEDRPPTLALAAVPRLRGAFSYAAYMTRHRHLIEAVDLLLEAKATINVRDHCDATPLSYYQLQYQLLERKLPHFDRGKSEAASFLTHPSGLHSTLSIKLGAEPSLLVEETSMVPAASGIHRPWTAESSGRPPTAARQANLSQAARCLLPPLSATSYSILSSREVAGTAISGLSASFSRVSHPHLTRHSDQALPVTSQE
ncbi:hypothetical protein FOZ60_006939 [Perkinsus olseni]|uniref:Uncharacterized protein n=1 Tax=Perkinsus olseni TaxID=32597 RepID=A0A7J6PF81_PEROL|nr:hypothetical protein FOZ60_006939 [Perkinsus olseni]